MSSALPHLPSRHSSSFCPTGSPTQPPPSGGGGNSGSVRLHPNGDNSKCLDLSGNLRYNGSPVQIYDCNGTPAQDWVISRGAGSVKLAGTNYCLDAGSYPGNGIGMKICKSRKPR